MVFTSTDFLGGRPRFLGVEGVDVSSKIIGLLSYVLENPRAQSPGISDYCQLMAMSLSIARIERSYLIDKN